ncbi:DL-endopeptidase inhibitor IseA family protein [Aneurinibacillus migulanus]|uniref:DL-endopeptidase inhibitor IseA family protein n=1 Tax=Aneurinibacillus migulanus TaxID=47500 RepID=UPI002E245F7C|nr:DL-endopeptidase inhibitor IseA family protein [Aneurinibacillus migulanus]
MKKQILTGCLVLSCGLVFINPILTESVAAAVTKQQAVNPTQIKKIDEKNIILLLLEAKKRYFYTFDGGKGKIEVFNVKNNEYRYLSTDIGTRKKLLNYLMKIFTKEASEVYIKERFIEHKGRMAQINADKGNILEFNKATAKLIKNSSTIKEYQLSIPYPENQSKPEIKTIKIKKVNGIWRIATPPEALF